MWYCPHSIKSFWNEFHDGTHFCCHFVDVDDKVDHPSICWLHFMSLFICSTQLSMSTGTFWTLPSSSSSPSNVSFQVSHALSAISFYSSRFAQNPLDRVLICSALSSLSAWGFMVYCNNHSLENTLHSLAFPSPTPHHIHLAKSQL